MKRTLMQIYVRGSAEALDLYQRAFGAPLVASYRNDDGTYFHAELDVEGQTIAVAEGCDCTGGDAMQFCLQYDDGQEAQINKAYETLKDDNRVIHAPGPCGFSVYMTAFFDKFGIYWCLFI